MLEDPNHRNETEVKNIRAFKDAACRMAAREDRLVQPETLNPEAGQDKFL